MKPATVLLSLLLSLPGAAKADELLDAYTAYLSADDHYNSSGTRLTQYWQVLRQDRANFHRFGLRDPEDQSDSFFASAENRAIAERMIRGGSIDPGLADYIVNNEVVVYVEIYGRGNTGTYVNVSVY